MGWARIVRSIDLFLFKAHDGTLSAENAEKWRRAVIHSICHTGRKSRIRIPVTAKIKHVLVVDDEASVPQGIETAALFAGYAVETICIGTTVFRAGHLEGTLMVVLECRIDRSNGFATQDRLAALGRTANVF